MPTPTSSAGQAGAASVPALVESATPTPAELYRELSPSVAFIETKEQTTGSGILIRGGYVLTDHHVVEFSDTVRVVFPNGTEILEAPIFAQDPQADLALIGPLDTALPEIALDGIAPGVPGEGVYLLGYPDETERYPEVTMTSGIISRYREMELHGYDFVQVDALIAPGQSGGVLVNELGQIVGISGLRFGEGNFGLVMSAETVKRQVDEMFAAPVDFSRRPIGREATITVPANRSTAFMIHVEDQVRIDVESEGDVSLDLVTLSGGFPAPAEEVVDFFIDSVSSVENFADNTSSGSESLQVRVAPGTYVISVGSFESYDVSAQITSNVELFEYIEEDEGKRLTLGQPSSGLYAHPTDSDAWLVDLVEGDRIRVRADSISDVVLVVRRDGVAVASGDDDSVGLFGTSVDFEFTVPATGQYEVIVGRFRTDTGGYIVQLDRL